MPEPPLPSSVEVNGRCRTRWIPFLHCDRFRTSQIEQIRIPSSWFEAVAITRESSRVEIEAHKEVGHRMVQARAKLARARSNRRKTPRWNGPITTVPTNADRIDQCLERVPFSLIFLLTI